MAKAKAAKKSEKKAAPKRESCTMVTVLRRTVRAAKTCDDQAKAFQAFKSAAAMRVASRFVGRAEKEKLYAEMLRTDIKVQTCKRPPTTQAEVVAVKAAAVADVQKALVKADDTWTRIAEAAARQQGQEMIGSDRMDGLRRYR